LETLLTLETLHPSFADVPLGTDTGGALLPFNTCFALETLQSNACNTLLTLRSSDPLSPGFALRTS